VKIAENRLTPTLTLGIGVLVFLFVKGEVVSGLLVFYANEDRKIIGK
jgi:hypothetical protein